jgi:hypothetical protein
VQGAGLLFSGLVELALGLLLKVAERINDAA